MKPSSIIRYTLSLLFGVAAFLFWWKWHPELISFQEQNQMFLFNADYFTERISVAGGLADYVSEFLTQFYFYVSAGAAIIALTLMAMQWLTHRVLKTLLSGYTWSAMLFSFFPAILMWLLLMDENTLLSYPIAIILALCTYLLCRRLGWLGQLIVSLPLYWLIGPAFMLQVGLSIIDCWHEGKWAKALPVSLLLAIVAVAWVYVCRMLWVAQYPWDTVLAGINYNRLTRFTLSAPEAQYAVIYSILTLLVVALLLRWFMGLRRSPRHQLTDVQCLFVLCISFGLAFLYPTIKSNPHDLDTHVILEQTYQLRKSDWQGIVQKAEEYNRQHVAALHSPLSCGAVNLALAKTHQLSTRMFEFPQAGIQGLIMPNVRDNVSNVTSMEVFWQLGFINESLRYAFDSQESIANCRKSSRFMKRMAECNILNGRYDVASKYIDLLKQTLFYSKWAKYAETYLYNEAKIHGFPEWDHKLQMRLENDFLYYYPEMPKMLGQLVLRNRDNTMAYDYFMASLLLTGDQRSFVANLPPQAQTGGDPFPRGYRKYVEYMRTQAPATDAITGASY